MACPSAVFLVSHSPGVVRETCERTIWIDRGRVVADGDTASVVDAYEAGHDTPVLEERLAAARIAGLVRAQATHG